METISAESRSCGIHLGMWVQKSIRIQRTSGPGASFTCINNAKLFFFEKAEGPYGDKVGYKMVTGLKKNSSLNKTNCISLGLLPGFCKYL